MSALRRVLRLAVPSPVRALAWPVLRAADGCYHKLFVPAVAHQRSRLTLLARSLRTAETLDYRRIENAPHDPRSPGTPPVPTAAGPVASTFDFGTRSTGWKFLSYAGLAATIARIAYARFENPSVLEMGCGTGNLLVFLNRYGIKDYVGIDGSPDFFGQNPRLRGREGHFMCLNLEQEVRLSVRSRPLMFDVICSFEVLEHIHEEKIGTFIDSLRAHMHDRSMALCTASLVEGLDGHVLVRDGAWWLSRFEQAGLAQAPDADSICAQLGRAHPFNWNPRNSNVFALVRRW